MKHSSKEPTKNCAMVCATRQEERAQQHGRHRQGRSCAPTRHLEEKGGLFPGGTRQAIWRWENHHLPARARSQCPLLHD